MTSPKISIILPVYNVERWIKKAVKSLQDQSFNDFEAFLVNDGSTDLSGQICNLISRNDSRFKVIHQNNSGAANARNTAIPKAKGKYLYFMDPDDWCEKNILSDMYNFAEKNNLELAISGYFIDTYYSKKKFYQEKRNAPNVVYKNQEEFRQNAYKLFDNQLLYTPWNKLYLNSYIQKNNLLYPDTFWDDLPFNIEVVKDIKKVGCINAHYYHFIRAREESENTKYRPDIYNKREKENKKLTNLFKYWNISNGKVDEFLARRYSERLIGCIENLTNKNCNLSKEEKITEISKMISTPHAIESFKKTKPNSSMMKIMLAPLQQQNAKLAYYEGKFISKVKENSTNIFIRLKANR